MLEVHCVCPFSPRGQTSILSSRTNLLGTQLVLIIPPRVNDHVHFQLLWCCFWGTFKGPAKTPPAQGSSCALHFNCNYPDKFTTLCNCTVTSSFEHKFYQSAPNFGCWLFFTHFKRFLTASLNDNCHFSEKETYSNELLNCCVRGWHRRLAVLQRTMGCMAASFDSCRQPSQIISSFCWTEIELLHWQPPANANDDEGVKSDDVGGDWWKPVKTKIDSFQHWHSVCEWIPFNLEFRTKNNRIPRFLSWSTAEH